MRIHKKIQLSLVRESSTMVDRITLAKFIWGAVISVVATVTAVAQYNASNATLRPHIEIRFAPSNQAYATKDRASHVFLILNHGPVPAKKVTLHIRTHHRGTTVHEDRGHELGHMSAKEQSFYRVHVHDKDLARIEGSDQPLKEDFTVQYRTSNVLKFWCDQVFTYSARFLFVASEDRWIWDPDAKVSETEECL